MNFTKALTAVVVVGFVVVCSVVLLGRRGEGQTPNASGSSNSSGSDAPPSTDVLELTLTSSVAKQAFINQAVENFNRQRVQIGKKTVQVKATHGTSGETWEEIKSGRKKPDLWSPGDESWIRIANDAWRGANNRPLFDDADVKPTVNVPLCIAMWEPMAIALGYPKPLGWSDLAKISADPQGWGSYGHPEWGKFKWGHAHPDANSGFLTVLAEVYAYTKKTKGLDVEDLRNPGLSKYLSTLEYSVEHYGLSNVWIETFMREKGPAYLSATVQYENTIIEGNRKTQNKPFKIVAIYPKEGTVITRHPIAIPQADWMTEERKEGAKKFVEYLLSNPVQTQAMELGLRPISSVPIASPFDPEFGVSREFPTIPAFEVPTEDILRRVTDLWLAAKKPASIMMLLDTSGSMTGDPIDKAKEGAVAFIERMQGRDELEVRAFNNNTSILQPAATVATSGETARQRINGLFASGGTHLYDVLLDAMKTWNERKRKSPDRHYGIVLLSDGKDEGSSTNLPDLMDVLPKGDNPETIKIFTIAYGSKAEGAFLKEIANKSNARSYESTTSNIAQIYKEISANF